MSNSSTGISRSAIQVNMNNIKTVNPVAAAKAELKQLLGGVEKQPQFQKAHMSKSILVNSEA